MKGVRVLWVLLGIVSCADTQETIYQDQGSLCLRSNAAGALEVTVNFPGCLGGCDKLVEARCSVVVQATEIVVSSRGVVETTRSGACTDECMYATARCESAPLEPGSYTVRYGSQSEPVVLPESLTILFYNESPGSYACQ
jgi:hypothetical protein